MSAARASATLAVVAQVLLEARDWGAGTEVRVSEVWEAIEARIPRAEVRGWTYIGTGSHVKTAHAPVPYIIARP